MRTDIFLLIIGMGIATYIPRAIPAVFIDKMKFGPKTEKFLKLIPYTAMAALIFPGILTVDSERMSIGVVGGLVALILAFKRLPLMACVLGAAFADFLLYAFFF